MTERIRGRRGQRKRSMVLDHNPLCVMCEKAGRVTVATEVDHIVPLAKGGEDTADNSQSLCHECHKIKTRRDMAEHRRKKRPPLCDENGYPIDPQHHWNQ